MMPGTPAVALSWSEHHEGDTTTLVCRYGHALCHWTTSGLIYVTVGAKRPLGMGDVARFTDPAKALAYLMKHRLGGYTVLPEHVQRLRREAT